MQKRFLWHISFLIAGIPLYIYFQYFILRADFISVPEPVMALPLMGMFAGLFLLYGLSISSADLGQKEYRITLGFSILFRILLIFALPNLSDDFYRFVWDGRMINEGINPFQELPIEFMANLAESELGNWQDLYSQLNSQQYYSVYPPVLQGVFALSTRIANGDVWGSIVIMKATVFMAELGTLYFLNKIVNRLNLSRKAVLLYALNPLVITELLGNLHFEAFMICFLLAAIWMLMLTRWVSSAVFLTLAIGSKLLPVLIFPFLIRRLGWLRTIMFGLLTLALTTGLFLIFFDGETIANFFKSIQLYFNSFQFNANIHYIGGWFLGGNAYLISRFLPILVAALILFGAWKEKGRIWRGLPASLLFALAVYQITSAVIHPWYLAPLIALSVLTKYRFAIFWSLLIPLTYIAYYYPGVQEQMWVLWLEYLLLFGFMAYELSFRRSGLTLEQWALKKKWIRNLIRKSIPARMEIKYERIARHLNQDDLVLDIGTGNGGLCHALRENHYDVQTVDIKDSSFFPELKPIIYDGERLPFPDNAFDTVIIITVLHHTPDPERILDEAIRVSRKKVVIMEDIYRNLLQKHLTFFTDSLVNLEFDGHPHTNKNDAGWRDLFAQKGLEITFSEDFRTLLFYRQIIYVLELPAVSGLTDLGQNPTGE